MSVMSIASMPTAVDARPSDFSFRSVVLFCCIGLAASLALMAQGIDLGAGLM